MNINDVVERFILISELEGEELSKYVVLCTEATEYIKSRLKNSNYSKDEEIRLCNAAAVFAYYKYCMYKNKDDIKSFSAGDVRIENSALLLQSAKALWDYELENISDLLSASPFAFKRVKA